MYDIKYNITFKANKLDGFIGLMFRKKDDFNYYSLDINEKWIRFRKMIDGKQTIISVAPLEPTIHMNIWYNVELTAKQNIFQAKII